MIRSTRMRCAAAGLGVVAAGLLAACDGGGSGDADTDADTDLDLDLDTDVDTDADTDTAAQVRLTAHGGGYRYAIDGRSADKDKWFAVLDLELENLDAPVPISAGYQQYMVCNQASVCTVAASNSSDLDTPCDLDVFLSRGGVSRCEAAFEIPYDDVPDHLLYLGFTGHEVRASIYPSKLEQPEGCDVVQAWQPQDAMECMMCQLDNCSDEEEAMPQDCPRCGCNPTDITDCDCHLQCFEDEGRSDCRAALEIMIECVIESCEASCN